ncbi:MAG TPA: methyltransferase domain-containing protein [Allosphingosinicella sp.]|nr:methyltransferase domain-containing protein [Allosphingosinicella sp.]
MNRLSVRSRQAEQMDDPALDPETYEAVLHDLSRVNAWTGSARPTLNFLARGIGDVPAFRLLDVGFGYGDMLRAIARWAKRRDIAVDLIGVDLNPKSAAIASAATPMHWPIEYRTGDYKEVAGPIDFIISSAVTHHMSDREIHDFLGFMEARAVRGWMVNDIHRHAFAYYGFPLLCRVMGWHRMVREDGQLSIARGFRPADWRALIDEAGLPDPAAPRIVRRFPFRLCVERLL